MLKRLRRENPRPNSAVNCALRACTIFSPSSDLFPDAPPHVPVKRGQPRIHGPRHALARMQDQLPQVGQQNGWLLGWHDGCGAATATVETGVESVTRRLYEMLFTAASGLNLCRIWHYVPQINEPG